jgi:hypothetical protein
MTSKEIDTSIVRQLIHYGIEIDKETPLASFDKLILYRATLTCIKLYYDTNKMDFPEFPETIPKETGKSFNTCTALAKTIKDAGYKRELGFDQFLYPNERDTRDLLSWLLEKIQPKEDDKQSILSKEDNISFKDRVTNVFSVMVKTSWVQRTNVKNYFISSFPVHTQPIKAFFDPKNEFEEAYEKTCPIITRQVKSVHLGPTLSEDNLKNFSKENAHDDDWTQHGLDSGLDRNEYFKKKQDSILNNIKISILKDKNNAAQVPETNLSNFKKSELLNSEFTRRKMFETEKEDASQTAAVDSEEQERQRQEEITSLSESIEKLKRAIETLSNDKNTMNVTIGQYEEAIGEEKQIKKKLEGDLKVIATTRKLFANKEENISKMQKVTGETAQGLIDLAREWETHRKGTLEKIRNLKASQFDMKNSYREKTEHVKQVRKQMEEFISDIRVKDDMIAKYKEEISNLPKDVERKNFVDRIMDVNKNVEKQKQEINKILIDNKQLNYEIQKLGDQLARTFAEAEKGIYEESSREEASKFLYKNVVEMREAFKELIGLVDTGGNMSNQIRDLEIQIEHLTQRNDGLNTSKIESDLNEIKSENEKLIETYKKTKN